MHLALTVPSMTQGQKHIWTQEHIDMLGVFPDDEVADAIGVRARTVMLKRNKLNVPHVRPERHKRKWTAEQDAVIGTASDKDVAVILGINADTINDRRNELGLPIFGRPTEPANVDLYSLDESEFPVLDSGRWWILCYECRKPMSHKQKKHSKKALRENGRCSPCGCASRTVHYIKNDNPEKTLYRGIRISWFNKFKAQCRAGREFSVTLDHVADVYAAQGGKCAITGRDIPMFVGGHLQAIDASLDRIDSSIGYVEGNVQIVHKHVNIMKGSYSQEYFIQMCNEAAALHPR